MQGLPNKDGYLVWKGTDLDEICNSPIINEMFEKYPKTMETMWKLMLDNYKVFAEKQSDYGPENIAMGGNDRLALLGITIRGNDKIQRILNLLDNKKEPKNESITDSFMDLANYCYMAAILMSGKWGK